MRKLHYILFVFLLIAQACDRITDTPEPDYFQELKPRNFQVPVRRGFAITSFNLLDSNEIKQEYQVIMGTPVYGTLAKGSTPGSYQYSVDPTFFGTDSVTYQICLNQTCKSGVIYFVIEPPHCRITAFNDDYTLSLDDELFLPVLENDSATCGNVTLKSISDPLGYASIQGNQVKLKLPDYYEGTVTFSYTIGNGDSSSTAQVSVHVSYDAAYCERKFSAKDDMLQLYANFTYIVLFPSDLLENDRQGVCNNIIDIESFDIPSPPVNSQYKLIKQNSRWWFIVNDTASFTSGTFDYQVKTVGGAIKTANVIIKK